MGTMKQADAKATRIFVLIFTVITVMIILICYVIPNDVHSFVQKTGWTKYLGLLAFGASLVMLFRVHRAALGEKSGASYWLLYGGLLILGICLAAGFNFDYFRLR